MDIDALREEGAQLAKLLGAVEKAGGWSLFAAKFPQRPRVRRAAPWLGAASDRAALAVAFANAVRAKEVVKVVEVKTTAAQQRKRANALSKRIAAAEYAAATAARAAVRADNEAREHLIRDRIDLVFEHAEHVEALEDRVRERHVLREG